jgi:penicillin-binding protein 1A
MFSRWWHYALALALGLGLAGAALAGLAAALLYPKLPALESLTDYRPKQPLRVYTADGALIGEFGEERRAFVAIGKVPEPMKQAIIAAEDERFYTHNGIDTLGVLRAASANLMAGGAREGASTITMQVARNFFLSNEKTLTRKLSEAMLAMKIEHSLSKDKILELYINQIYLGQRAYGFEAAAMTYFGKPLTKLRLPEFAMLAGLPKAPSRYNPVVNYPRAKSRQEYVLKRMQKLGFISAAAREEAVAEKLVIRQAKRQSDIVGDYAAEMVRQTLFEKYGESVYSSGLKATTTLLKAQQDAASRALHNGAINYDLRHSYRGAEGRIDLAGDDATRIAQIADALADRAPVGPLAPAVVVASSARRIVVAMQGGAQTQLDAASLKWVERWIAAKKGRALPAGSIVRVMPQGKGWRLAQIPEVEAALIALDPDTGAITALAGGFDFGRNKFNHVTQAWRQPGSSFKPFIYSAALERGYTPATLIDDAPLSLSAAETGSDSWDPKNYDGTYSGPTRLRSALTRSLNLVSIRILQGIGPQYARDYTRRFGFDPARHPPYLTMALGAGSVTPLQLASAYGVFANGGHAVKPYLIKEVRDSEGRVLMRTPTPVPGTTPRVIDPRNAYLMTTMMQDVVRYGTGARARQLGRADIAGKTGTTNDARDTWFAGFNRNLVAVSWMGYDQPRSLGRGETGGNTALPIWIDFMARALAGKPQAFLAKPAGVVDLLIDAATGQPVAPDSDGLLEHFYEENLPVADENSVIPDALSDLLSPEPEFADESP